MFNNGPISIKIIRVIIRGPSLMKFGDITRTIGTNIDIINESMRGTKIISSSSVNLKTLAFELSVIMVF